MTSLRTASVGLLGLLLSCTGAIEEPPRERPGLPPTGPTTPEDRRCEDPGPGAHPLRRLTTPQYEAMLERLFPDTTLPSGELRLPVVAVSDSGYDNDAHLASPIASAVEAYRDAAILVSEAASSDLSWMDCTLDTEGCLEDTVLGLAATAFRGDLDAEQEAALRDFVATESPELGAEDTLTLAIQAILESPSFLYVPEVGDAAADAPEGMRALTPAELANRLALFLWDEPADDELLASVGPELLTDAGLEARIDTMLEDARAEAGFERFVQQWMPLRESGWGNSYERDETISSDMELMNDLRESALRFLRYAFLEATIEDLLTSRTGYVNDRIAPLFGIEPPGSDELVAVELPAEERSGILTHPAVLATAPRDATFYSVYRGVMIMNQVLCIPPGLPQFDMIDVSEGSESGRTSRERLEEEHLDSGCRSCHEVIDGIGFALGNFDALGRFRTEEVGQPIDPSGRVFNEDVADAIEMTEVMSEREEVAYCITQHLYTYAIGRSIEGEERDLCQVQTLADELASADGELRGLARAIAQSNSFRYMIEEE